MCRLVEELEKASKAELRAGKLAMQAKQSRHVPKVRLAPRRPPTVSVHAACVGLLLPEVVAAGHWTGCMHAAHTSLHCCRANVTAAQAEQAQLQELLAQLTTGKEAGAAQLAKLEAWGQIMVEGGGRPAAAAGTGRLSAGAGPGDTGTAALRPSSAVPKQ